MTTIYGTNDDDVLEDDSNSAPPTIYLWIGCVPSRILVPINMRVLGN